MTATEIILVVLALGQTLFYVIALAAANNKINSLERDRTQLNERYEACKDTSFARLHERNSALEEVRRLTVCIDNAMASLTDDDDD